MKPSAGIKQSSSANKKESAKKLVQARLPFKILSSSSEISKETNKRKLSYSSTEENDETLLSTKQAKVNSATKENLSDSQDSDVLIESDDENVTDKVQKNKLLVIKLPKANKRKKSKLNKSQVDESEIIEVSDCDDLNPQKKLKVLDDLPSASEIDSQEKDAQSKNVFDESVSVVSVTKDEVIELIENEDDEEKKNKDQEDEIDSKNKDIETKTSQLISTTTVENTSNSVQSNITPNRNKRQSLKQTDREKLAIEKQKKKELEEQKRQEREDLRKKEKERKEDQRKKEREEKESQRRKEKEEKEDLKRKEREEKEDIKKKEKEEKEKKRLAEIEMKNEEKRLREEKRDEERRKKEMEKEEIENKKKKAAEAFTKFFKPKSSLCSITTPTSKIEIQKQSHAFMPFQVKGDMKLAPLVRRYLDEESKEKLNELLTNSTLLDKSSLYLDSLKSGKFEPFRTVQNKYEDPDDVLIIEDELQNEGEAINLAKEPIYRAKYFYFKENRRPPFYGTWRKKSELILPRRPFALDTTYFCYDVDSDEEWEEDEPGESLHGSDDEKESDDEYEVDNDFFVPHGHLSDEELQDEDDEDNSPETQKAKLKIMQQEFANEMKKKTEKIKPRLIGTVWADKSGGRASNCPENVWQSLNKRAMICLDENFNWLQKDNVIDIVVPTSSPSSKLKRCELTEDLVVDLIRLVHGNKHKKQFLVHEFQAYLSQKSIDGQKYEFSKATIRDKIDEIAKWTILIGVNDTTNNKKKILCWAVGKEILDKYNLNDLKISNKWKYILPSKHSVIPETIDNEKQNELMVIDEAGSFNKKLIKCNTLPDELIKDLIHLVHGNRHKKQLIIREFFAYIEKKLGDNNETYYSKSLIRDKIDEMAKWTIYTTMQKKKKLCWTVSEKYLEMYDLKDLSTSNEWKGTLSCTDRNKSNEKNVDSTEQLNPDISTLFLKNDKNSTKNDPPTSENTKDISTNSNLENDVELISSPVVATTTVKKTVTLSSPNTVPPKKRVSLLMSVPRGQSFPTNQKNSLISNFLKSTKKEDANDENNEVNKATNETCVVIN